MLVSVEEVGSVYMMCVALAVRFGGGLSFSTSHWPRLVVGGFIYNLV